MVNVGEYTVRRMDRMGIFTNIDLDFTQIHQNLEFQPAMVPCLDVPGSWSQWLVNGYNPSIPPSTSR